ncbi:hypothetical protein [Roseateles sp.]|uniref:hypothetical protein n=1 Tax=Roseateles sp. TaxID=1971397 RepID=UPI0031D9CA2C
MNPTAPLRLGITASASEAIASSPSDPGLPPTATPESAPPRSSDHSARRRRDGETLEEPHAQESGTPPCTTSAESERRALTESRADHPIDDPSIPPSICEDEVDKPLVPLALLGSVALGAAWALDKHTTSEQRQPLLQQPAPLPPALAPAPTPAPTPTPVDAPPPHLTLPAGQGPHALFITGRVALEGLRAGASWSYSLDGGNTWHAGDGDSLPVKALGESGAKHVLLRQLGPDGRDGRIGTQDFELRIVPDAPAHVATSTGQAIISASDWISPTGLDGAMRWEYSLDGGQVWQPGHGSRIETNVLLEGDNTVLVRQIDDLGHAGGLSTAAVSLDTVALRPQVTLLHDTGLAGDLLTADGTVIVAGIEPGAAWSYSLDGGATWMDGRDDRIPASDLGPAADRDREVQVQVRQTDAVGNTSASASLAFTLLKALPALTASLANDTGASAQDQITRDASLTISGVEASARTQFRLAGSQAWLEGDVHALFGADDAYTVELRQIDVVGRASPVTTLTFTLDTQGPAIDLSEQPGIQEARRVVADRAQSSAGVPLTETTAPLFEGSAHVLHMVFGGDGLDPASDVVDFQPEGMRYTWDLATFSLSIWREDGGALSGLDAATVVNKMVLHNHQENPRIGERTFTITAEDIAGNLGAPGVVTIVIDPGEAALAISADPLAGLMTPGGNQVL